MQGGVTLEVGLQVGWAGEGQLDRFGPGSDPSRSLRVVVMVGFLR